MPGLQPAFQPSRLPVVRPNVSFGVATTDAARQEAALLANRIYCEEHLGRSWADGRHLFDENPFGPTDHVLIARCGPEVVATVCIHHPDPLRAVRERTVVGLPIEASVDLSGLARRPLVQVSRAACARAFRGNGVSHELWLRVTHLTRAYDVLVMAATGLTTDAEAAGLWQQLHDPSLPVHLPHQPGVRGPEGVGSLLRVPWLIESYGRFGLHAAGRPVWFDRFGMYDLPMWRPAFGR
jgi:hypothetical protein